MLGSCISGNWYDPAQSGHGFQFEVLKGAPETVLVFWFTFDRQGRQAWITGTGEIDRNRIRVDAFRVLDGRFPPQFDPQAIRYRPFGRLDFLFTERSRATVTWTATDSDFSSTGSMNLQQLTEIAGTQCP